jgi:hypothetical protein
VIAPSRTLTQAEVLLLHTALLELEEKLQGFKRTLDCLGTESTTDDHLMAVGILRRDLFRAAKVELTEKPR